MKIIKIDKRFKVADRGFKVALRFDTYSNKSATIERWCRDNIGPQSWADFGDDGVWKGYFGRAQKKYDPRPYYIAFKDEAYITSILLIEGNDQ